MKHGATYAGVDVRKQAIAVSVRFPGVGLDERTIPYEARLVNRLVWKWTREAPGAILCAYRAWLLESGLLARVYPSSPEYEAVRGLCRADEGAKEERVGSFKLRFWPGVMTRNSVE